MRACLVALASLAVGPFLLACGAEHDDVAGAPEWEVERDLVIGSMDDPATALHQVADIVLDQEGRIRVLEAREARVRTYHRDGTLAEELGGRGGGPGEFTRPTRLGWRGDTLWVGDGSRHRLTLFADGDAPVTISLTTSVPGSAVFGALQPGYLLDDGSVLATPSVSMRMLAQDQEGLDSIPWIRTDREGTIVDTLFWSRRAGSVVRVDDALGPGSVLHLRTPFSELSAAGVDPTGRYAVRASWEPGECESEDLAVQVTRFAADRDFQPMAREIELRSHPLDEDRIDSAVDAIVRNLELAAMREPGRGFAPQQARDRIRAALDPPSCLPPVTDLMVDRHGSVWLRGPEVGEPTLRWTAVDHRGRIEGFVELPPEVDLMAADGNRLYGVEIDELGVERVVGYAVHRR